MEISRKCIICKNPLFNMNKRYKYCGDICRKVAAEISRTKYRSRPEIKAHMKEYAKKHYQENSERIIEYNKNYRLEHEEEKKAYQKVYNEEHKEEIKKKRREYYLLKKKDKEN